MEKRLMEWKRFNLIGAVCVFSAMFVMLMEIFLTSLPDGARIQLTSQQLLEMYNRNWFMGMRYMGLINIIASTLMIPVYYSLYGVHRDSNKVFAGFALVIAIISYAVFLSDNVSFPILELSKKYSAASESEKLLLVTATESLFAKGASHTPGTFPGFLLGQLGSILFNIVIIKGKQFKKIIGIIGTIAFSFLLIFEILSSFITSHYQQAMIFAMMGGISAITWYVLIGLEFLKLHKKEYSFSTGNSLEHKKSEQSEAE
ncbi:MAG: DUF4386 family protein [Spirochaetales bacterium]|nr:DUF4386 family protein [Spirochaetales bacterium]